MIDTSWIDITVIVSLIVLLMASLVSISAVIWRKPAKHLKYGISFQSKQEYFTQMQQGGVLEAPGWDGEKVEIKLPFLPSDDVAGEHSNFNLRCCTLPTKQQ